MSKGTKEYWSMTEGVFNCLIDEKRTKAFSGAISNTVKKGDVVVDMGTGSGVLAMLAVRAGAKKVYAVEFDKNNIATLTEVFRANKLENKITLIQGDVTKVDLPEKVDVIIGEMIATALVEELQVPAMNNILRFAKKSTKVVLREYKTYVDLVNNNENYYGNTFKIVRYEYPELRKLKSSPLSIKHLISDVDFSKINKGLVVNEDIEIKITKDGIINGVRLSSKSIFSDNSILDATFAYSYPIILPIPSAKVKKGDLFSVRINYKICGGMQSLKYSVIKKLK